MKKNYQSITKAIEDLSLHGYNFDFNLLPNGHLESKNIQELYHAKTFKVDSICTLEDPSVSATFIPIYLIDAGEDHKGFFIDENQIFENLLNGKITEFNLDDASAKYLAFGPLLPFIGTWESDGNGMDVSPDKDTYTESNPFHGSLTFEPVVIPSVHNAAHQQLKALMYRQIVVKNINQEVFHDESGYVIWDENTDSIIVSFSIPRAVALNAGGDYNNLDILKNEVTIDINAKKGSEWEISESPFLAKNGSTKAFKRTYSVSGDQLNFSQTTSLFIYGKDFEHTDNGIYFRKKI